ncbi:MAG: hypothetical protein LBF58_10820 [Deltaproteobacteria bacterium]|nr:hypothetical protein [Deltaproteobacteria bacterium]
MVTAFRGLTVAGVRRGHGQIPYPEPLGLASEIALSFPEGERIPAMAARLKIARLPKSTREKLAEALKAAQTLKGTK